MNNNDFISFFALTEEKNSVDCYFKSDTSRLNFFYRLECTGTEFVLQLPNTVPLGMLNKIGIVF